MVWRLTDPEGYESQKIRWELVPYTMGQTLDVGCGQRKPFAHFIGVDNFRDQALFGHQIRPDVIADADDLSIFADGRFDSVFSSHCLEHIEDHKKALKEWWRVLKVGGYLCLYLPDADLYPNIGVEGANPDHKHDFHPSDIVSVMQQIGGWDLVRNESRDQDMEYSFFQVYKKARGHQHAYSWDKPRPAKSIGVVRYGAIGDLLQMSSVFAGLKKQGWHITLHTSPPANVVVEHDPNIDAIVLQGKDQVPNLELGTFWKSLECKYDRFINFSESVEGSLLALPGRTPHAWAPLARHKFLNRNYLETMHDMAGVPHEPQVHFFATEDEKQWARKFRNSMNAEYVILWALAGSSVHKTWAYIDAVIAAALLHHPGTHFILTGDAVCQILECGWEKETRVRRTSGTLSIRQTLALLDVVDCVVGPETGVLNGAANLPIPKLVFLSHSSHENLSRDWVNAYPLAAADVHCKGRGNNEAPTCHQLHYGWDHCTKDSDPKCEECKANTCTVHTKTAACMVAIKPDTVTNILFDLIERFHQKAA